jgi:hypothetical protein
MKQTQITVSYDRYSKSNCQSRASKIMKIINNHETWTSDKFVKYRLPDITFWRSELNKLSDRLKQISKTK